MSPLPPALRYWCWRWVKECKLERRWVLSLFAQVLMAWSKLDNPLSVAGDGSWKGLQDEFIVFGELNIMMGEQEPDGCTVPVPCNAPVSHICNGCCGIKAASHDFKISKGCWLLGFSIERTVSRQNSVTILNPWRSLIKLPSIRWMGRVVLNHRRWPTNRMQQGHRHSCSWVALCVRFEGERSHQTLCSKKRGATWCQLSFESTGSFFFFFIIKSSFTNGSGPIHCSSVILRTGQLLLRGGSNLTMSCVLISAVWIGGIRKTWSCLNRLKSS